MQQVTLNPSRIMLRSCCGNLKRDPWLLSDSSRMVEMTHFRRTLRMDLSPRQADPSMSHGCHQHSIMAVTVEHDATFKHRMVMRENTLHPDRVQWPSNTVTNTANKAILKIFPSRRSFHRGSFWYRSPACHLNASRVIYFKWYLD